MDGVISTKFDSLGHQREMNPEKQSEDAAVKDAKLSTTSPETDGHNQTHAEVKCVVCLETHSAGQGGYTHRQNQAEHGMCASCLPLYVDHQIQEGGMHQIQEGGMLPFACPYPGCGRDIELTEQDQNLTDLRRLIYLRFWTPRRERWMGRRGKKKCPYCGSENIRLGPYYTRFRNRFEIVCNNCSGEFCLFCNERVELSPQWRYWSNVRLIGSLAFRLGGHECADLDQRSLAKHVRKTRNAVKPCPKCFDLVHRWEGCRNMRCESVLGCNCSYCFDCVKVVQGSHDCEMPFWSWPNLADLFVKVENGLRVMGYVIGRVFLAPFVPIVNAYRAWRDREDHGTRAMRRLQESLRRDGVSLYSVPIKFITLYATLNNGLGIGRWDTSHRCIAAYRVLDDALVYLHPHALHEPCDLIDVPGSLFGTFPNMQTPCDVSPTMDDAEASEKLRQMSKNVVYIHARTLLSV